MEFVKPKKIFIVDDDELYLLALKEYLTRDVHHLVSVFKTGEECLEHINEKPEIILLDYHLNSISRNAADGMEILETIKKHYPDIHIVMMSSQEKYGIAAQTIVRGAEQYVVKDRNAFEEIDDIVRDLANEES
jgi:two-component system OmpR family response regulator